MITYEQLKKCKYIFFHSGCPDGIAAREILLAGFPELNLIPQPYHFGMKMTDELHNKLTQGAIFVDIHPNLDEIDELMEKYFILIADHHETSRMKLEEFIKVYPNRIDIGRNDLSESGAWLAYMLVWLNNGKEDMTEMRNFATLIALSDTWKSEDPRFPIARNLANWIQVFGNHFAGIPNDHMWKMIEAFNGAARYKNESLAKSAIIRDIGKYKIAFISAINISDAAEILRNKGVNIIVGYQIANVPGKGERVNYSIRCDDTFNARLFAQENGGGGHDKAAGCSLEYTGDNPIGMFLNKVDKL